MEDVNATALDWKEIDTRLGEIEPEIAREVLLDVLADEISPLIALSRLLLAMGGAAETEEAPRLRGAALGAPPRSPSAGDGRPLS